MTAKQLTDSILQLAIQGKLVPQNPDDEPASVLLDRIREEKKRLVKEGKLKKKDIEETPINDKEKYTDLPDGWEWSRIGCLGEVITGGTPSKQNSDYYGNEYPFYKPGDLDQGVGINCSVDGLSKKGYEASRKLKKNSVLVTCIGATIGKAGIISKEGACNQQINAILPFKGVYPMFLYYSICAPYLQSIIRKDAGKTTLPIMNKSNFSKLLIPLPPFEEQKRIVDKIIEVLPYISEYGAANDELEQMNAELPEKLKKSILQEAIMGKLGTQDPKDEPASVLLDRIREEKKQLVKAGVLKKKDLVETPVEEDEIPFDIPEGWQWCRVSDISESYIGLTYKPSDVSEKGWIVLRSSNIQNGEIDYNDIVRVNVEVPEKLHVKPNDIIICARNGSKKLVGKSAIVKTVAEPMTFGAFMAICRTPFYNYMAKYLLSSLFFGQLRKDSDTTTINQLTQKNFNRYLVPLPPLAEQHRIVEKIEALFAEVDHIKI